MDASRLKPKDLAKYRESQLKRQKYKCPLCGTTIKPEEAVLDHDHSTGYVRSVLHRSCNQVEGRVLSWVKRSRSDDPQEFLRRLLAYWRKSYYHKPIHPSHKNETEREILKLQRRKRKVKTDKKKKELQEKIQELRRNDG